MYCSLLLTSNRRVGSRSLPASLTKTSNLFLLSLFLNCGLFGGLVLVFFSLIALSPTDPKSCDLLCRVWKAGHRPAERKRSDHTHGKQSCPELLEKQQLPKGCLPSLASLPQTWEEMTPHSKPRRFWHHHTCTRGAAGASPALCAWGRSQQTHGFHNHFKR